MASTRGPLDASLFSSTPAPASPAPAAAGPGPGPAGAGKDDDTSVLAKGQPVWYWHARSGAWMAAKVTFVDLSLRPPAYQVMTLEDENVRDTERPRLRPRIEEQVSSGPAESSSGPAEASSGPAEASAGPATGPGSAAAAAAAARATAAAGASAAATAPPAPSSSYATVLHSEDPNIISRDKRVSSSWEHIASSKAAAAHASMLASTTSAAAQDVADDWGTFASAGTHCGLCGVYRGLSYVPRAVGNAANGRAPDSSMSERAAETRSPPTTAAAGAAADAEDDDDFGDFASAPPALHSTTVPSPLACERLFSQNSAASGTGTASQGRTALPSHPQSSTAQRDTGRTNAWTSDGSATHPSSELFAATANGFSHAPAALIPSPQARDHSHATQPRALSPSPLTYTSKAHPAQPPALGGTGVADFSADEAVAHQHQAPGIASVATPPATPLDVGCVHTPPASAASVADNAAAGPAHPEASAAAPPAPAAAAAPDNDWDIDWGDFTSHAEVELNVPATSAPGTHELAAAPTAAPDGDDDWGNFTALLDAPLHPSAGASLEGNGREAPVDDAVSDDDWGDFTSHVVAGRADTTRMADTGSTKPAANGSDGDEEKLSVDGVLSPHHQPRTFTGAVIPSDAGARDASMFAPPLTGVRTSTKSAEPETRGAMSHVSSSEDTTFRTGGSSFVSNLTTPPGTARADLNASSSDSTFVSPGDTGKLSAPSSAAGSAPVLPQAAAVGSARASVENGASGSLQLNVSRCLSTLSSPPASARAALPADLFRLHSAESFAADSDADALAQNGPKEAVLRRNVMFSGDMRSLDLAMNFTFDDAGAPSAAAADCAAWCSMDAPGEVQRAVSRPAIAAVPHGQVGDEIPVDSEPLAEISGALDVAWTEDSAAAACSQPLSATDSVPLQAPAGDPQDAGAGESGAAAHIGHTRVINSLAFEPDFPAGPHDGVTLDDNPVFSPRTSADTAYVGPGSSVERNASGARNASGTTQHIEQLAGPAGEALSLPASSAEVPERESGKGTAADDDWGDFSRAASDPVPPISCAAASQLPLNAAPTYLSSVNDAPVAHFTGDLDSLSSLSSAASGSHALDLPEAKLPGSPRAAAPPTSGMPPTPSTSRKGRSAALSSVSSIAMREAAGPHAARASSEMPARTATADASDPFAASLELSVSLASHPYDDIDVADALDTPLAAESTRHDSASMARASMSSEPAATRERLSSHPLHASASLLELGGASVSCSPPAEASSDNAVMAQPSGAAADGPPGAAVPRVAMNSGAGTPTQRPQRAASPFERPGHAAPEAAAAPTFTAAAKLAAEADADRVAVDSGAATAACTVLSARETMIISKGGSLGQEQSHEDASAALGDAALGGPGNDPKKAVVDLSEDEEDEWGDFAAASTSNDDSSGAVEFVSASDRDEEHTNGEAAETQRGGDEAARCSSPQPVRAPDASSSPRTLKGHASGDAERSEEPEVPHLHCAPLVSPLAKTGPDAAWQKSVELGPGPDAHAQGPPETSVNQGDPGSGLIRCGSSTGTAVLRHGESLGYSEPDDLTRTGDTLNAASRVPSTSTRGDASASVSESPEAPRGPMGSGDEAGPGTTRAPAGSRVSVSGGRENGVDASGVLAVEDALSEMLRTVDSGTLAVDDALSEMLRSVDSGVLAVEDALAEMLRAVDEADTSGVTATSGVTVDDTARTGIRPIEQVPDDQMSDTSARGTPEVMAAVSPSGVNPATSTPVASFTITPTHATSPHSSAATSVAQAPEAELGPELSAEEAALQAQLAAATREALASGGLRTALAHACIHVLHLAAITAAAMSARGIAAEGAVAADPAFWRTAHAAHRLAPELSEAVWPVAPSPPKPLPAPAAPPRSIRTPVHAGVRLFTSSMGGSSKVTADTRRIVHILEAFAVPYEVVDLSVTPDRRLAMLETSEGEAALPQLHAHGTYIGDAGQCLELHDFGELVPELQSAATADDATATNPEVLPSDATSNRDSNDVDQLTDELRGQLREAVNDARLANALAAVGDLHDSESDSLDDSRPANQDERCGERCQLSGLPLTGWKSDDVRSVDGLREMLGDRLDGMTGRCIVCAAQLLSAVQSD